MKVNISSPSYLIRNKHSYCFRMRVPGDLCDIVGKKELRYSLKTGCLGIAKRKARFLAAKVELMLHALRKGGEALNGISNEVTKDVVAKYIRKTLNAYEEVHYNNDVRPVSGMLELKSWGYEIDDCVENLMLDLVNNDYPSLALRSRCI